jgi:hypothetical protein
VWKGTAEQNEKLTDNNNDRAEDGQAGEKMKKRG